MHQRRRSGTACVDAIEIQPVEQFLCTIVGQHGGQIFRIAAVDRQHLVPFAIYSCLGGIFQRKGMRWAGNLSPRFATLERKFTGRDFPMRSGTVYEIEPEHVEYMELPFEEPS